MSEWLEADGLGGFAMGTADGIRTRRYHAVLLAAVQPPDRRMVLVADLEVHVDGVPLSSHRYGAGVVHPDGASRIVRFTHEPWPRWEWQLPDARIACELVMAYREPMVSLRWSVVGGRARRLEVRPLLAGRDYHATHHENPEFRFDADRSDERVTWRPYPDVPAVHALANATYTHAPDWYRGFHYSDELARGLDHLEDLAMPGVLAFDLAASPAVLAFSTSDIGARGNAGRPGRAAPDDAGHSAASPDNPGRGASSRDAADRGAMAPPAVPDGARAFVDAVFAREASRRAAFASPLARAADAYIVPRGRAGRTIIAGYPWFADWGRDTFISLRGLCLVTGRRDDARAILCEWATAVSEGMLPNRFDEHDATPEYNSVDAALWFVIAADAYLAGDATPADRDLLQGAIAAIVDGYAAGTRHQIGVGIDCLVAAGEPGVQLTWMDARVDGECITPRIGKPVEIQALWINALEIAGRTDAAGRARASFSRFWDAKRRCLYDVIDVDHIPNALDATCRPNQIFAVGGLPHPILDGERARAVVDTVERLLWTEVGPRSLAPSDPRYHGRYLGNARERDQSYHNGPVWPWLAGAFIEAWVRVRGNTADAKRDAHATFVAPLLARAAESGHLAEIYDGDAPHRAVGCPFQAWSLAELIRVDALLRT